MTASLAPLALAAAPMVGRIQGGWPYVWAAYAVTWAGLGLYTVSLLLRALRMDRKEP